MSANGIRLHLAECGPASGEPVLLLHGFPEFWWSWRHQLTALGAAGHRAVAVDLRGYCGSDRPPRGYDLWTLAGDVAGLVPALGARRATVIGAGWGGAVAWTLATLHPRVVSRLAVVAAPHPLALRRAVRRRPWRWTRALRDVAFFQLPRLPERSLRRDRGAAAGAFLTAGAGAGWPASPEFAGVAAMHAAALLTPRTSHCSLEYFRWAVRSQARPDGARFAAALERGVEVPVLHVRGEVDPWVPDAVVRDSARWAPAHEVVTVPGAGHFPHQEAPRHVGEVLLRRLSG
ncbi:alpha/beta hydrolase [Actinomycetospora sp. NBRC 106378]|uniref:alpha/beta fold hydrolase n=1 Tax=Actinomycetospora sp. NBRC 106378 TaxID=3032208 RepID=UPI0024A16D1F|nr:alpha/beta hydrolase [Actinomycetospora sp. NBRC 106378]GLZ52906.1 alpha/beta hydrolase [Actinomycetospora sp. NBRC 106378]